MENQMEHAAAPIERMLEQFNVTNVFGEAIRDGDTVVVPVAEVTSFFGYGYGSGEGPMTAPDDFEDSRMASGSGGGAGGRGVARPKGYITITPDGVRYEPLEDPLRMSLAGMAMAAWVVFWAAMVIRAIIKR
jgi:uncharacterized spore protein YtfJ